MVAGIRWQSGAAHAIISQRFRLKRNGMAIMFHEGQSFKNLTCTGKKTEKLEFESCSFTDCDFSKSLLESVKFVDCVFTNCNLTMVKLTDCNLTNVVFRESKLLGVSFIECKDFLFSVRFDGCVLDYCSFARKKMLKTSFTNSSMKGVDFSATDLTGSLFSNVDLSKAIFNKTVLRQADLSTATNFDIDPESNNIRKAKFSIYGLAGLLGKYDIEVE
jgi:uncharacterized protein YjbI with pentapeptide repeats